SFLEVLRNAEFSQVIPAGRSFHRIEIPTQTRLSCCVCHRPGAAGEGDRRREGLLFQEANQSFPYRYRTADRHLSETILWPVKNMMVGTSGSPLEMMLSIVNLYVP